MIAPPTDVKVLRTVGGKSDWITIKSTDLVPGDILLLKRDEVSTTFDVVLSLTPCQDEVLIPCDSLIISGSCMTNEAMLTGESTPQLKVRSKCTSPSLTLHHFTSPHLTFPPGVNSRAERQRPLHDEERRFPYPLWRNEAHSNLPSQAGEALPRWYGFIHSPLLLLYFLGSCNVSLVL